MKKLLILVLFSTNIFAHYVAVKDVLSGKTNFGVFLLFVVFVFSVTYFLLKKKNNAMKVLQEQILEANKNLELRVKEATSDLERAQEIAHIGSWILNPKTKELIWSKETYKIFDVDKENVENLFQAFLARIHPEDKVSVLEAYEKSLEDASDYSMEHRLLMDDGTVKYVLETCETSFDENSQAIISHGTVQDITQRTLVKKELKKKDALMFQQSRLAQMGEMLSMISHQWRQPLGAISASTLAIKMIIELEKYDLSLEEQRKKFLSSLDEKLDKISLYVQNLSQTITDFSSFYKPHQKADFLNIDDVLLKSYRLIEDSLKDSDIEVIFKLLAKKEILMHENEFMQVILNIINNAKEQLLYKKVNNPKIYIQSKSLENQIYIEICDNAGGIDKDIIGKIFNPYFSTKLEKNGTGLGLYMSKIILKDYHNGDIYAKNTQEGAVFIIKIDTTPKKDKIEN